MIEKIFAWASEKTHLSPGENVWVNVDVLMTRDVCGPGSIGNSRKSLAKMLRYFIFNYLFVRILVNCSNQHVYKNNLRLCLLFCNGVEIRVQ